MTEKVSVIIPVYNEEKYLRTCLDSVIKQTYTNLEIILINDGSTDSSDAICQEYCEKDPRVRLLNQKNGGVGASRNAGLAMATGDYILFVDSDDWLHPQHIEILYNLLKKNKADVAVCNFNNLERDHKIYYWVDPNDPFEKNYTVKQWFQLEYHTEFNNISVIFAVPWCKLYKRSLFKHIAYPVKTATEDDLTTWKTYLLADKISYVNRALYTHRFQEHNTSGTVNKTDLFPLEAVEARLSLLKLIGFDTAEEEGAYRWRLQVRADNALKDGDYVKYQDAQQKLAILKKYQK